MSEPPSDDVVYELRRNWHLQLWSLVVLAACWLAWKARFDWLLLTIPAFLATMFGTMTLIYDSWRLGRARRVRLTPTHLELEGHAPIAFDDILGVRESFQPYKQTSMRLALTLRGRRSLMLAAPSMVGASLLQAIGTRRATHRLVSPMWIRFAAAWCVLLVLGAVFGQRMEVGGVLVGVTLLAFILSFPLGLVHGSAQIGIDGIAIRWLGQTTRFIPFADVAEVPDRWSTVAEQRTTHLVLRNGQTVRLRAPDQATTPDDAGAEPRALDSSVKDAFYRWARRPPDGDATARLERGERTAREWLASIDLLARSESTYRGAPVDLETLQRVVDDAGSPAELRVAAAVALLRAARDPRDRRPRVARIRVVAESTVDPATRDALTKLSTARTDDDVLAALDDAITAGRGQKENGPA